MTICVEWILFLYDIGIAEIMSAAFQQLKCQSLTKTLLNLRPILGSVVLLRMYMHVY